MIGKVFAIRDFKTGFLTPTVEVNPAAAVRNFEHAVLNTPNSLFFSHPGDYALYEIGEYDTDSGVITPCVPVNEVITAQAVINAATARRIQEVNKNGE